MADEALQTIKDERLGGGLGDGNGLSWTCNYCRLVGEQKLDIGAADRKILRALAAEVAGIAAWPEQGQKRERWRQHNDLKETVPLVFCDPELAWYEVIPAGELKCAGPLARIFEFKLRKEIYWAREIRDDRVALAEFPVHTVFSETSRGLESRIIGGGHSGAYTWDTPLADYSMLESMKPGRIAVDHEKTKALLELTKDVFGGILEVPLRGSFWWTFGLTGDAIRLRGFEQMLYDMYDHPDGLHALMAFLRDESLEKLDFLEQNGLLSQNSLGDFVGTGGYGFTGDLPAADFEGPVRTADMWGFAESQETVNVSPEFFAEFVLPYQKAILERFGLNIYGCCEPLDKRWDAVQTIPRLRRVTVSPWSDPLAMAEKLGPDYVYCRKINPAIASTKVMDDIGARADIRATFEAAKKYRCPAEIMLRDVVTLGGNPKNAADWVRIAREEASRIY
jgi:hypothetical protein